MSAARLEDMLDRAMRDAQHNHACGLVALHNVAEAAIAQVRVLERRLQRDERKARSDLYPKSGNVIPLGTKGAPATFGRPGA